MEEKKQNRKALIVAIALVLLLIITGTFAWMTITKNSTTINKITAGSLDLILDESTSEGILLQNQVPMSFQQGITTKAYTFKLKNNSTTPADYSITLEDYYDGVTIPTEGKMIDEKIRYVLLKNDETPVASNSKLLSEGRTIETGVIQGSTEVSYTLYIWINSTAGVEVNGQIFSGRLNVEATQTANTPINTLTASIDKEAYGNILTNDVRSTVTEYKRVSTISDTYKTDDYKISTTESEEPIYMWVEDGKVNWYSEAGTIYLPEDSLMFFANMPNLTSLNLKDFNSSKVTNMTGMFSGSGITSLDFSQFDTSNVTNMTGMFSYYSGITSLDLRNLNLSNVTNMYAMFNGNSSIETINMSGLDLRNVNSMYSMFSETPKLKNIDLSNIKTDKLTNVGAMFWKSSVESVDLTGINTNNVTNMQAMFNSCNSLTTIDLSSFDTSNLENMDDMFSKSTNLKTIYVSNKFVTTNITNPSNKVFEDATSLVGGNGTTYDSNHMGADYARIDTASTPGYFTAK